jgi:TIR domain
VASYAFLSYQTADKKAAGRLKNVFAQVGIKSFLAHEDIAVSQEWRLKILEEIAKVDLFVCLISKSYMKSPWCVQESGVAAFRSGIAIIPLSLDGTTPKGFIGGVLSWFLGVALFFFFLNFCQFSGVVSGKHRRDFFLENSFHREVLANPLALGIQIENPHVNADVKSALGIPENLVFIQFKRNLIRLGTIAIGRCGRQNKFSGVMEFSPLPLLLLEFTHEDHRLFHGQRACRSIQYLEAYAHGHGFLKLIGRFPSGTSLPSVLATNLPLTNVNPLAGEKLLQVSQSANRGRVCARGASQPLQMPRMRLQETDLQDANNYQAKTENPRSPVVEKSPEAGVVLDDRNLRQRANHYGGLLLLFILACYGVAIWMGGRSLHQALDRHRHWHWFLVGLAVTLAIIGTLSGGFLALPWDWHHRFSEPEKCYYCANRQSFPHDSAIVPQKYLDAI